jgi:hypothetical protein
MKDLNLSTPMNVTDVVAEKVLEFNDNPTIQLFALGPNHH